LPLPTRFLRRHPRRGWPKSTLQFSWRDWHGTGEIQGSMVISRTGAIGLGGSLLKIVFVDICMAKARLCASHGPIFRPPVGRPRFLGNARLNRTTMSALQSGRAHDTTRLASSRGPLALRVPPRGQDTRNCPFTVLRSNTTHYVTGRYDHTSKFLLREIVFFAGPDAAG
jgi:hypothetical protein